ncbi:MAG TPA: hypothetical protein VLS25_05940 [Dehalococcoidia bacterium]|nr:hypothetical protein [Dehalococcoidia bacterium]
MNGSQTARAADPHYSVESVVWELGRDYAENPAADAVLPINRVYLKTHDGTDWMSVYDQHPNAISGPEALKNMIAVYKSQGIDTIAWFVPKGGDIEAQLYMARAVLDAGATALYADIEPYPGFCYLDCAYLAQNFWPILREQRPNADLGVMYDPRPEHWGESGLPDWMRYANTALPMCYWTSFVDQPPWNDPAGCVTQARADLSALAPGAAIQYVPLLQGDAPPEQVTAAMDAGRKAGALRAGFWRRGSTAEAVWAAIATFRAQLDAQLTEPPDPCLFAWMRLGRRAAFCDR